MGKYNEELVKAGVLLAGEGLHASSKGARIKYSKDKRTVTDGPFTEAKELIVGFWLIQVTSKERRSNGPRASPSRTARSRFARCSRRRTSLPRYVLSRMPPGNRRCVTSCPARDAAGVIRHSLAAARMTML